MESDVKVRAVGLFVEAPDTDESRLTPFGPFGFALSHWLRIQWGSGRISPVSKSAFIWLDDICAAIAVNGGEALLILSPVSAFAPCSFGPFAQLVTACPFGNMTMSKPCPCASTVVQMPW
jgi:hypothetical protein